MRPGLRWLAYARTVALLAVGLFAVAGVGMGNTACLRTESLGTEQTAVVGCEPTSCRGTPTVTPCADGTSVASTGRCVRSGSTGRCDWEPGTCAVVNDTGAPDTPQETSSDSGSDALMCSPGTEPLIAIGPWDDLNGCWIGDEYAFECISIIGVDAVETCFLQFSTGKYYLAMMRVTPSGGDYRQCTKEEHDMRRPARRCL